MEWHYYFAHLDVSDRIGWFDGRQCGILLTVDYGDSECCMSGMVGQGIGKHPNASGGILVLDKPCEFGIRLERDATLRVARQPVGIVPGIGSNINGQCCRITEDFKDVQLGIPSDFPPSRCDALLSGGWEVIHESLRQHHLDTPRRRTPGTSG